MNKEIGFDGNKKVKGRKRHIVVDTMGLLLVVWVHSAGLSDRSAAVQLVEENPRPSSRLKVVWADLGYESSKVGKALETHWEARLELKKHAWQGRQGGWVKKGAKAPKAVEKPKGFVVLKWRWVVERTFGWLGLHRRHSKDYETLPEQSEFFIKLSMIRKMLTRLSRQPPT